MSLCFVLFLFFLVLDAVVGCVFFYYSCLDALFGCVFVDVAFTCLIDLANSFPLVSPIQLVRLCPRKYSDFLIK